MSDDDKPEDKEAPTDELTILETKVLRKVCLEIHLHRELEMIRTGNFDERAFNLESIVDDMFYVYNQLHSPLVQDGKWGGYAQWPCKGFEHVRHEMNHQLLCKYRSFEGCYYSLIIP